MFVKILPVFLLALAVKCENVPEMMDPGNAAQLKSGTFAGFLKSVADFINSYSNGTSANSTQRAAKTTSGWLKSGGDGPAYSSPDLDALGKELYRLDQQGNAAAINVNWNVNTRSSNGKLFTKLDKSVFDKPTYKTMISMFDNYEAKMGVAEKEDSTEKTEQSAFLDSIIATPVMQKAFEFLQKKFPETISKSNFKTFLQRIWFTTYSRRGQPDTSGFEHVFVGEVNEKDEVEGFHNWVKYAIDESSGAVKYGKWKGQSNPDLYGMQFTWNGLTKIKSTIAIGESPEMSIAVLTTCFMVASNSLCVLKMGEATVNIMSYRWDNRAKPNEYYVASAYYDNPPPTSG